MNLTTTIAHDVVATVSPLTFYEDPLDHDEASDATVVATRRGLTRLALVAVETGARFQREGLEYDPMAWMLAPRRMFEGSSALQACLDRTPCVRALILHGLSIGLDAEADDLDDLISGTEPDSPGGTIRRPGDRFENYISGSDGCGSGTPCARLFTATLVHDCGGMILQAFHASVAENISEIRARLRGRYGLAGDEAIVAAGFDSTATLAKILLSPATVDLLHQIEAEPESSLALGLDLNVEQRFAI